MGLEPLRGLLGKIPSAKIVFPTQETTIEFVQEALDLGAVGSVHKFDIRSELLQAVDAVLAGRRFVSSGLGFSFPFNAEDATTLLSPSAGAAKSPAKKQP